RETGYGGGSIAESSAEYAARRYNDEVSIVPAMSLYFSLCYMASILNGINLALPLSPRPLIAATTIATLLLPSALYTLISTARLFTLSMTFNLIGGYLAGLVYIYHGSIPTTTLWRLARRFTTTFAILVCAVVVIQVIRQAKGDFGQIDR